MRAQHRATRLFWTQTSTRPWLRLPCTWPRPSRTRPLNSGELRFYDASVFKAFEVPVPGSLVVRHPDGLLRYCTYALGDVILSLGHACRQLAAMLLVHWPESEQLRSNKTADVIDWVGIHWLYKLYCKTLLRTVEPPFLSRRTTSMRYKKWSVTWRGAVF